MFSGENRDAAIRILLDSVDLGRIEHVCSTFYVTVVTCLAAGLSENAAKFGLSLNVSSIISHSLNRLVKPLIPETQPLLGFFARATCASLGILAAFRLEKSLLVWANCLFGAELIISAIELTFSRKRHHAPPPGAILVSSSPALVRVRTTCIWGLAGAGLLYQHMPNNEMPFWIKGVLIGPRMFEYGLQAVSLSMKGNETSVFFR